MLETMRSKRFYKSLLLLLAIVSVLAVTSAANFHAHADGLANRCEFCAVAHLPVVQPLASISFFPPVFAEWHLQPAGFVQRSASFYWASLSRGPPR